MVDENKIKALVSRASNQSLEESRKNALAETAGYDLEREFARTAKNRNWFVALVTAATAAGLVALGGLASAFIERENSRQAVDISSFADMNLKELLDLTKRAEDDYARYQRELEGLRSSLEAELAAAEAAYRSERGLIDAAALSSAERQRRIRAAEAARGEAIRSAEAAFGAPLAAKERELAAAGERLNAFDSRMLVAAKENEERLAAERRRYDLERAELERFYAERIDALERRLADDAAAYEANRRELLRVAEAAREAAVDATARLYNPIVDDPEALAFLSRPFPRYEGPPPSASLDALAARGLAASALKEEAAALAYGADALRRSLAATPYFNSVPAALAALEGSAQAMARGYERLAALAEEALAAAAGRERALNRALEESRAAVSSLTPRLAKAEAEAGFYGAALESYAGAVGSVGLVLGGDGEDFVVWLGALASSLAPTRAYAVRGQAPIAYLSLTRDGRLFRARALEFYGEERPRAFDAVVPETAVRGGNQ